ncbi:AzlD domain-containing protein [Megamonas funiformis]|uniref:AzlD domain-containing protein n=1 Tax=Megamonas funiformis TaxID=437897 RepID=UPI000E3F1468|nr:AzlD domain-containing protein [Megamonas funiformis]RGJ98930.1 AzlD domain-containing protein [Megamonas funiformis]
MSEVYIYILVMALTSFTIRVLPLTLIQTEIKNPLIKSFLYYVPYITLAVMTFPAIIQVTQTPLSGAIALVIGIVLSWFGANLFQVASSCCLSVFVVELLLL